MKRITTCFLLVVCLAPALVMRLFVSNGVMHLKAKASKQILD